MDLRYSKKQELSNRISLKMWLPLLQCSSFELEDYLRDCSYDNPFVEIKYSKKENKTSYAHNMYNSSEDFAEDIATQDESLYSRLYDQIEPSLFPTPKSQNVANDIIEYIDEFGYFDGDISVIAIKNSVTDDFVESIRLRFAYLEPSGVGAKNMEESFMFQLADFELDQPLKELVEKMINNLSKMDKYAKHPKFEEAKNIIKKLRNPPAIEYMQSDPQIIPDFFIDTKDEIVIRINNSIYPDIYIKDPISTKNEAIKEKIKEARNLVNMLQLRKSTLYKIILMIVERQTSFFVGGELKPLTMKVLASEFGFAESTISRAIANKYVGCDRGVFPLKHFFTNSVSQENLSSSEIKSFIKKLIEFEDKYSPMTDDELLAKVSERFKINIVRRSITKYRLLENIPSSKERVKIYRIQGFID